MDAVSVETMASAWGRPSGEVLVLCGTWVLAANVVLVAALMFTRSMSKMMSPWCVFDSYALPMLSQQEWGLASQAKCLYKLDSSGACSVHAVGVWHRY